MSAPMARWARLVLWIPLTLLVCVLAGCSGADADQDTAAGQPTPSTTADGEATTTRAQPETSTTLVPIVVKGRVVTATGGDPLAGATISVAPDGPPVVSGPDGSFELEAPPGAIIGVARPGWLPAEVGIGDQDGDSDDRGQSGETADDSGEGAEDGGSAAPVARLTVELEPFTVRGIRVSRSVADDPDAYRDLLDLADRSSVNTLVFDTKDESGTVLYPTGAAKAAELDAVRPVYDPADLVAQAHDHDLHTITRVVTFEDRVWARGDAEAKLAGAWVDATDRANWEYPIELAVEACDLGFDEIQFDYVRYPAGRTAAAAAGRIPGTAEERSAVIGAFLDEARSRLAPAGCGVSAAIFGIVVSSPTDEGIGQLVEAVAPSVDAISPMIYPSHYNPGWMGFPDPNDHPGPVVGRALDDGLARIDSTTLMRPWIQAFYYDGAQIGAEIQEAEQRGAGWILWNASGNYRADWLPPG